MDDVRYAARELRAGDRDKIRRLLSAAPSFSAFLIRPALQDIENFGGWWFGALADGEELEALICVEGHTANLYSRSRAATRAMASAMLKQQEVLGSIGGAHRHQLIGRASDVDDFWTVFKHLKGRTLLSDRFRPLMVSGPPPEASPSKRVSLGYAKASDLRIVYELTAERQLERQGADPRKTNPQAHSARCRAAIEARCQVIGREGDKPVFVAELRELDAELLLIDQIAVPLAFRGRKRLIGGALYLVRKAPQAKDRQLVLLADDEQLAAAAELAGFRRELVYRQIVTFG